MKLDVECINDLTNDVLMEQHVVTTCLYVFFPFCRFGFASFEFLIELLKTNMLCQYHSGNTF